MTKTQAETEIAAAQAEAKRLSERAQKTWSAWHSGAAAEYKRAEAAISSRFTKRYQKLHTTERKKVEDAERAVSALRCKYAGVLCGYPIESIMGEWVQSWSDWKPTGRTGTLEVYRTDTEWPGSESPKPQIGSVIIRVIGKNGKPTKTAQRLSREPRDSRLMKYVWLPVGQRPKE